jgi:hypothetical protein
MRHGFCEDFFHSFVITTQTWKYEGSQQSNVLAQWLMEIRESREAHNPVMPDSERFELPQG